VMNIRFTEQDWQRIARDWSAWWAGDLERPLVVLETFDKVDADWSQLTKYGPTAPVEAILENWERILAAAHFHGDAYPKWWVNFGPGTVAAFLGSRVSWTPDTTWFWPLEGIQALDQLHLQYDPDNLWWRHVQAVTRGAVERWGRSVVVGITDLGGNLDILASLCGSDRLLLDLTDQPEQVDRLVGDITRLWLRYYDELCEITDQAGRGNACWGPCWSPGHGYMLQCDFSYMISPRMFRRFVLPDLEQCCAHMEYGFYHLDGKGELPHLDMLLGIERLRGVQWQPGDGQPMAEGWLDVLRRIRAAGKLCQIYVTRQGALAVKRALGGKGFLMHIVGDPMTAGEAERFLVELERA